MKYLFQVQQYQKREKLISLLDEVPDLSDQKTLVFVEEKKTADFLATILCDKDVRILKGEILKALL